MNALAQQLARARAEARVLDIGAAGNTIRSLTDAYLVQDELAAIHGGDVRGWKVTALVAEQQRGYEADKPVAGALFAPFFYATPANVVLERFVSPLLECEIAYVLGNDLPPRGRPYRRADIEAAVEAIVPAMEIADCRWPLHAPDLLKLADNMGNGCFVVGAPISDWRGVHLGTLDVALSHAGAEIERGPCARVLGDPLLAVLALANAQPLPAGGLRKGQIVTTGSCIQPVPLTSGDYVADFGPLGKLSLSVR
jgi:2-keto-4-pentenoate hydratase